MAKLTKEQKRKAKLKAKKQQAIHDQQSLTEHLSIALKKLCEPVLRNILMTPTALILPDGILSGKWE